MPILLPHYLPVSLSNWLQFYLPFVRTALDLPADDVDVIQRWNAEGVKSAKLQYSKILNNDKSICFGASPELSKYSQKIETVVDQPINIIAADGATRWFLDLGIEPTLVVTDLDGLTLSMLYEVLDNHTPMQILLHGDNISKVADFLDSCGKKAFKTVSFATQGPPSYSFENTIGFTDGDRSVSLAVQYSRYVYLAGFNLRSNLIGKYSKPHFSQDQPMTRSKRTKLEIAYEILNWFNRDQSLLIPDYRFCPGVEMSFEDFIRL